MHSGDIWSELGKLMKQLINWNLSHQSPEPSAASFTFQTISWWPNRTLSINTQESMRYCHVATNPYWHCTMTLLIPTWSNCIYFGISTPIQYILWIFNLLGGAGGLSNGDLSFSFLEVKHAEDRRGRQEPWVITILHLLFCCCQIHCDSNCFESCVVSRATHALQFL